MSQDEASAGTDAQGDRDAVEQELPQLRARMSAIREEVAAEVHDKWSAMHRTQELFDLKVKARLAAHQEYRSLQDRVRYAEAALAAGTDAAVDSGAENGQ